jgi:hypothetical protein
MRTNKYLAIALLFCCGLLWSSAGRAQSLPRDYYDDMLEGFYFDDYTNWTDVCGDFPLGWTNLTSVRGDGPAVLIDNPNGSLLQYPIVVDNKWSNLSLAQGSVMFWFYLTNSACASPGGWALDAGQWGTFLEAGAYTPDASYGWWSLYTDGTNVYFSAQDAIGNQTNYLSAPLNWNPASNCWTHLALTYSPSNGTQLFLNGALAATGPNLSVTPDLSIISNSFSIGSSGGSNQLHAAFDDIEMYDCVVDGLTIAGTYGMYSIIYLGQAPTYTEMPPPIPSAPSSPTVTPTFNAVTGPGYLTPVSTNTTSCINSPNFWLTNVTVVAAAGGGFNLTFSIAGGSNTVPYDVYANSVLDFSSNTNLAWAWMGQGCHCVTYQLTNLTSQSVFLLLGNSQVDADADGLSDAFERLVSKTNPNLADSSGDGMLDGWKFLWGLNPLQDNPAQSAQRSNYDYNPPPWLDQVSGARAGAFTLDAEGNVQQSSQ